MNECSEDMDTVFEVRNERRMNKEGEKVKEKKRKNE